MEAIVPGLDQEPLITWEGSPLSYIRRVFTGFIQGIYQKTTKHRWSEDADNSEIFISGTTPVNAEAFGQRPCIAVGRTGIQWAGMGIGAIDEIETRTGAITKSDLINGMVLLHHISRSEAEAEDLAFFTAEMVWLHWVLLNSLRVGTLGTLSIEQPTPPGSLITGDSAGLVNVSVAVPYRVDRTSRIEPLGAPILEGIRARINAVAPEAKNHPSVRRSAAPENNDPANIRRGPRTLLVGASQSRRSMRQSVEVKEETT